jgi:hypothetical protein
MLMKPSLYTKNRALRVCDDQGNVIGKIRTVWMEPTAADSNTVLCGCLFMLSTEAEDIVQELLLGRRD